MENPPFEDVFPIENGGFSIAMFVYRRVDGMDGFGQIFPDDFCSKIWMLKSNPSFWMVSKTRCASAAKDWGGLSRDQAANRIHKFISSTQDEHGEVVHLARLWSITLNKWSNPLLNKGFLGDEILPSKKKGIIS